MSFIVFDIGGSKMRIASADSDTITDVRKIQTPQNPEEAFILLCKNIKEMSDSGGMGTLIGGVAGIISSDGTIKKSPNLSEWNGFPLRERLEDYFKVQVVIKNDADFAGLGEAFNGAGKRAHIVAYFGIGTGVGGTRIVDGVIDIHAGGFEPGCQIVDIENGATLESLIGGNAFLRTYGVPPADISRSIYEKLTPTLAVGIWNAIVHWSPDIFILGGSLMNDENGYRIDEVISEVEKIRVLLPTLPDIVPATLGDENGLYGAIAMHKDMFGSDK